MKFKRNNGYSIWMQRANGQGEGHCQCGVIEMGCNRFEVDRE